MSRILIGVVRVYQKTLSPILFAITGPSCRFHPSCSQYAVEALAKHGALKGSWYAAWRVLRCQPLSKGGYDPVPSGHSGMTPACLTHLRAHAACIAVRV